jgi:tetratricopeptide (TPR) repeat protein
VSSLLPELEHQRDQALRDLADLERQVSDGQITPQDAGQLRQQYETEALLAIHALKEADQLSQPQSEEGPTGVANIVRPERTGVSRRMLYATGLATLVLAGVLVPQFVVDRPPGGYVTGNEVLQQPGTTEFPAAQAQAGRSPDLSEVSNKQLEAVVNANPDVTGMRLALARRYTADNRFDLAVVHYKKVLEQDPDNARAQAGLSWILLQLDEVADAERLAERALRNDPESLQAMWVHANILLYGLSDPPAAAAILDTMLKREDLHPAVRQQVRELRSEATARQESDR